MAKTWTHEEKSKSCSSRTKGQRCSRGDLTQGYGPECYRRDCKKRNEASQCNLSSLKRAGVFHCDADWWTAQNSMAKTVNRLYSQGWAVFLLLVFGIRISITFECFVICI